MPAKYPNGAKVQIVQDPSMRGTVTQTHTHGILPVCDVAFEGFQERFREVDLEPEGTPLVWRDDLNPKDTPTVNTVVWHAADTIEAKSIYTLSIAHVDTFPRGRGFMASVKSEGSVGNSNVHIGQSQISYDAVMAEGRKMLDQMCADLEEDVKKYEGKA